MPEYLGRAEHLDKNSVVQAEIAFVDCERVEMYWHKTTKKERLRRFYISIAIIAIIRNRPSTMKMTLYRYLVNPPKNANAKKSGPIPKPCSIGSTPIARQTKAMMIEIKPMALELVISITESMTRYNAPTATIHDMTVIGRKVHTLNHSGPMPKELSSGSRPSANNNAPAIKLKISLNSIILVHPFERDIKLSRAVLFINVAERIWC